MSRLTVLCAWLSFGSGLAGVAAAFNPPTDSAGPLSARIDAPTSIQRIDQPIPVKLIIGNRADAPAGGKARLGVIDGWRVEPDEAIEFTVAARSERVLELRVRPAGRTYPALYPIHAFVDAEVSGSPARLHPVLIVETQISDPGRPVRDIPWRPVPVEDGGALGLWRLPVRRVLFQRFGATAQVMPVGWSGAEPGHRGSLATGQTVLRGATLEAIAVHPPWFGGAGTAVVEYPLRLPESKELRLSFSMAIRDHNPAAGEPPSDGVTFRVRVLPWEAPAGQLGAVLYERHTDAKQWEPAEVDLRPYAGRTVRLQLETHPGPKNDTTCDQAYWGRPILRAGSPTDLRQAAEHPARSIGRIERGRTSWELRVRPGRRGLLDAVVEFAGPESLEFRGFQVRVMDDMLDMDGVSRLVAVTEEPGRGCTFRHRFASAEASFDLLIRLAVEGGILQASVRLENTPPARPWQAVWLQSVRLGPWNRQARRVYAGTGNVVVAPKAFEIGFDGHRLSTSFVGFEFIDGPAMVQAVDVPPEALEVVPEGRLYTLRTPHAQTISLIPATSVWEGARIWHDINGLRASGGVAKLAGRFVFDLWAGRYRDSAEALRKAFRYGLTDAAVVWHNWQRWGYDYRLPDIYPPNPLHGTLDDMRELIETCRRSGVLLALHDNYIDFYPDAEGYSYEHIAFGPDGRPVKAWLNEGRKAQSYRWRADRYQPFLERNLRAIREGLSPTAYFVDVWSSAAPYDYWTADGAFFDRVSTRDAWARSFAWIRDFLGGAPQISESGHDQLIGYLDGAQTNHLRVGRPGENYGWLAWPIECDDAERVPWFDAAHHDRFALHGAGYESRYCGGLDPKLHGIHSDDYICTEVLTGHPGMVHAPFSREVVRKYWLTQDLMRALAMKRIEAVEFEDDDIHRQHVTWSGGGHVFVNRSKDDWTIEGHVLPPFGFYARVAADQGRIEAAIERQGGAIVEWATSGVRLYCSARPAVGAQATATGPAAEALRARLNPAGRPIAFRGIQTDGAFRLVPDSHAETRAEGRSQRPPMMLIPLPASPAFTVRLPRALAGGPEAPYGTAEAIREDGTTEAPEPLHWDADWAILTCRPGVFAYRLR